MGHSIVDLGPSFKMLLFCMNVSVHIFFWKLSLVQTTDNIYSSTLHLHIQHECKWRYACSCTYNVAHAQIEARQFDNVTHNTISFVSFLGFKLFQVASPTEFSRWTEVFSLWKRSSKGVSFCSHV